jgi:hypothetical protein
LTDYFFHATELFISARTPMDASNTSAMQGIAAYIAIVVA